MNIIKGQHFGVWISASHAKGLRRTRTRFPRNATIHEQGGLQHFRHSRTVNLPKENNRNSENICGLNKEKRVIVRRVCAPSVRPVFHALPMHGYLILEGTSQPRYTCALPAATWLHRPVSGVRLQGTIMSQGSWH